MPACGLDKLSHLTRGALFDVTCSDEKPDPADIRALGNLSAEISRNPQKQLGITHVSSCGRPMPILKILQTTHCEFNCNYCAFRHDSDRPRESIAPDELARTTAEMAGAGLIEGIFLSSGIGGSVHEMMTRIVDTGRILREKYRFPGYIHLKILPGSPLELIEAAGKYADRISINLEAPSESALRKIAPNKSIKANILERMQWVETLRRTGRIPRKVGQVTQFVVGGSDDPGENDRALVTVAQYLYKELNFRRIYYSSFNPVPGTPLEGRAPEDPRRSFRLYQADRLIAQYGWTPEELAFNDLGRLDLETDPKEAWARVHPEFFPIEVTRADQSMLLRIPGIGPVLAKRIMRARMECRLRSVEDFLALGQVPRKSLAYVTVNGRAGILGRVSVPVLRAPQLKLAFS
jgi:predicted DNA-binding helix-hairpin-helix protein